MTAKRICNLIVTILGNFAAISYGIGVFEHSLVGLIAGAYSTVMAMLIVALED